MKFLIQIENLPRFISLILLGCMIGVLSIGISPASILADNEWEGEVLGEWTIENSPYNITGDIYVPEEDQLTIEPGVEVVFMGAYHFWIEGLLIAESDLDNNQIIRFIHTDSTLWHGIYFGHNSSSESIVHGCEIINPWVGIDCDRASPSITNNRIIAQSTGINCVGSNPRIINNHISVGGNSTLTNTTGISLRAGSNAVIRGNDRIEVFAGSSGEAIGIYIERSLPTISENWIEVRSPGIAYDATYGIFAERVVKLDIDHNIIRVRSTRFMTGMWTINATGVIFINNDVILIGSSEEISYVLHIDTGSEVVVINNILFGNGSSVGVRAIDGRIHAMSGYNDIYLNNINYQGPQQDFRDIYEDPMFVYHAYDPDEADYELRWDDYENGTEVFRSPCIDTGHPDYLDFEDQTRSDIGRFYFEQYDYDFIPRSVENPQAFLLISNFPNPFNNSTVIHISQPSGEYVLLDVFDMLGRQVERIWAGELTQGDHILRWNPENIPSNLYIIRYESQSNKAFRKVILQP